MQGGVIMEDYFENASFVRIKDVSISYNLPRDIIGNIGLTNLKVFMTGRNLFTFSQWTSTDPELVSQSTPLQKEFMFGLEFGF